MLILSKKTLAPAPRARDDVGEIQFTLPECRMPYLARITRQNPSCFGFLVDHSESMKETAADGSAKADAVAEAINRCLDAVVDNCTEGEEILNYFHVGVIGPMECGTPNPWNDECCHPRGAQYPTPELESLFFQIQPLSQRTTF